MQPEPTLTSRGRQIRQHMEHHVRGRLNLVLTRYQGRTDPPARSAVAAAQDKYQLKVLLEKGAKAAKAIAIASHLAKGVHPDLKVKEVTNLAVDFASLPTLEELGSHVLAGKAGLLDATGDGAYNNAAYELYLLLDSKFEGQSLASWLEADDEDAAAAFAAYPDGPEWSALLQSKCPQPATSPLSKQVYWLPTPGAACENSAYVLLVPLFPASLAHQVYTHIQADRFDQGNWAAAQAKRQRKAHDGVYRHYPHLAVQNMGGTKPQNISQLNSERRGMNYLLSSLPPQWQASAVRLPVHAASVFDRLFIARPEVRRTVRALRVFLESDPEPNLAARERREELLDALVDEVVSLAAELQQLLPPGWSRDDERFKELGYEETLWLDPLRAEIPEEAQFAHDWQYMDWPAAIGKAFAGWLNAQLRDKLPVGDAEAREWKKVLLTDEDGFKQQLRELRDKLDAPHYIPIRKTHAELVALREENP